MGKSINMSLATGSTRSLALAAFLLPVHQTFCTGALAVWFVISVLAVLKGSHKPIINTGFILMISLFLLYIVGLGWSANKTEAMTNLGNKAALIFIPLLFLFLRYDKRQIKYILYGLFAGILFSLVFCLFNSTVRFSNSGLLSEFMYFFLSKNLEPAYLGYFANIAISILLVDFLTCKLELFNSPRTYIILILTFSFFSFILLSRVGIATTLLLNSILIVYWLMKRKWMFSVLVLIYVLSVPIVMVKSSIWARERLWDELKTEEVVEGKMIVSSTTMRLEIRDDALAVFKNQPLPGVGTGDVQDELNKKYAADGFNQAFVKNLNAHNQFIQTGCAVGIPGILIVISILVLLIAGLKQKYYLSGLFGITTLMFFMTESVLEAREGVTGFVLFTCLLLLADKNAIVTPKSRTVNEGL